MEPTIEEFREAAAKEIAEIQERTTKRFEELASGVEETKKDVLQVSGKLDEKVSEVSEKVEQVKETVGQILARGGYYHRVIDILGIIGGILTSGLIILLAMGIAVPEGYIAIITAIVGAMAGSLIPQS